MTEDEKEFIHWLRHAADQAVQFVGLNREQFMQRAEEAIDAALLLPENPLIN